MAYVLMAYPKIKKAVHLYHRDMINHTNIRLLTIGTRLNSLFSTFLYNLEFNLSISVLQQTVFLHDLVVLIVGSNNLQGDEKFVNIREIT